MKARSPKEGPASRRRDGRPWYERPYGVAAALMVLLVAFATYIGLGLIGWLALPLIGIFGLLISLRLQINDGDAVPDHHFGSTGVYLMTLQDRARNQLPPEQTHHHAFERRERRRLLKAVNGIWIAYCALGIVMFLRQNGFF